MPKFPKSTGYKMKGFSYPGESPLKIASVSGAQLIQSVGKTYDKYVNYGKIVAQPIAKAMAPVHEKKKMKGEATEELEKVKPEDVKAENGKAEDGSGSSMLPPNYELGDLSEGTGGLGTKKKGGFGSATLQ